MTLRTTKYKFFSLKVCLGKIQTHVASVRIKKKLNIKFDSDSDFNYWLLITF